MGLVVINLGGNGGCRVLDIGWGLLELVDIKGVVGMSR